MKRIGILGTGAIAHFHARCWDHLPAELVGYYDVNPEAAQKFSREFGGRAFTDLDEFFDHIDIVDICTPAAAHKENILAAAAAGKAITCEKPLARHLSDCEEIINTVESTGLPLFVAHVVRFFPEFVAAKSVIDSGSIGTPAVIRTVRNGSFPRLGGTNSAYGDFAKSGGVILDVAIHDIDFQRWCCGEVERVFTRGLTFSDIPEIDHALITLRFENGAIGHIESSWAHQPGRFRTRLEIAGDEGLVEWDSLDRLALIMTTRRNNGTSEEFTSNANVEHSSASPLAVEDGPYYAELAHFLNCIEHNLPLRVTPHDALMAVKVSLAAIESMRTGKPVIIAEFEEENNEENRERK